MWLNSLNFINKDYFWCLGIWWSVSIFYFLSFSFFFKCSLELRKLYKWNGSLSATMYLMKNFKKLIFTIIIGDKSLLWVWCLLWKIKSCVSYFCSRNIQHMWCFQSPQNWKVNVGTALWKVYTVSLRCFLIFHLF